MMKLDEKLREQRDKKIIELYRQGYKAKDIAPQFRLSERGIQSVLKKHKAWRKLPYFKEIREAAVLDEPV